MSAYLVRMIDGFIGFICICVTMEMHNIRFVSSTRYTSCTRLVYTIEYYLSIYTQ